ncbi:MULTISPECIES: hypothetical protein [unclassified Streptomyces]|uniref:hypothetical protein n=1 Tax=unclassified Streptomyces TaxID=2593676 RepID=UPI00093FACE6|nr:hypothetical protein [Streptomyces sp. TSRI0281]OKI48462.1 hypothetical protein A6A29_05535 [Streptomyces sp. TSRI0281]
MHRTRITAKILVGVAVTAVSGCVSVEPSAEFPPRPGVGRPVQDVAPQIVQPPAREALEALPDPTPSPSSAAPSSAASTGAPSGTPRVVPRSPRQREAADPSRQRTPLRLPRIPLPEPRAVPRAPAGGTGVCALGRGYGGWPAGSPQSTICDQTYGG